jgi:hypothetical protein
MTDVSEEPAADRARRWPFSMSTVLGFVAAGVASLASVALRLGVPITSGGADVDDRLYVRIATFLAHGQWLGPFDQYTLLKGPAYPGFVAAMYRSGVPLKVGEQLTYLLAAAALATCVGIVTRRTVLALVAYVVLALDPVNFAAWASRVTRDGWYSSLSMLLLAAAFLAVYAAVTHVRLPWVVAVSVLAGLAGAVFWLCREEPVWIAPSILVIVAGLPLLVLARWWFARPRAQLERSRVLRAGGRLVLVLAVIGVVLMAPIVQVARVNERHYGEAITNDLVYGAFARTYADWRRVDGGRSRPTDPITRSQREAVYAVSPAARLLQPYVDPSGPCPHVHPRLPCGEPIWKGLRDAAAAAGYFRTEADAQRFFGELDAQIQAGCQSGELRCTRRLPTELQSLQVFSAGRFFTYLGRWGGRILTSSGFYDLPSKGWIVGSTKRAGYMQVVRGFPAGASSVDDQMSRYAAKSWPYRLLSLLYRLLIPCLVVAALIGAVGAIVRFRWPQAALSVLSLALAVGALTRLVFVALLNDTQFGTRGIDVRYLLPAHALFVAFGVVGAAQLVDTMWAVVRERRTDQPAEGPAVDDVPGAD